jgi:hypothetical protein
MPAYSAPGAGASQAIQDYMMQEAQQKHLQLMDQIALQGEQRLASQAMTKAQWEREDREKEATEKEIAGMVAGDHPSEELQKRAAKYHIPLKMAPSIQQIVSQPGAAANVPAGMGVSPGSYLGNPEQIAMRKVGSEMQVPGASPEKIMASAMATGQPNVVKGLEPWLRTQETSIARADAAKTLAADKKDRQEAEDKARLDRQREHEDFMKTIKAGNEPLKAIQLELAQGRLKDQKEKSAAIDQIVGGVKAGLVAPTPEGLGRSGAYTEVVGKLAADGFNLAKAQTEWLATKRNIATIDGVQFKRLESAEKMVTSMTDRVDRLAKEWDSYGIGPLSRARLTAAQQGALGQKAQSLAARYDQLIKENIGELAIVIKGGGTPTNEDRQFAEKTLESWWAAGTVLDVTEQMRATVNSRIAITGELGGMTPGGNQSRYESKPPDTSKWKVTIQ